MAAIQSSGKQEVASTAGTTFTFNMPGNFTAGSTVLLGCTLFRSGTDDITGITVNGTAMVKDATFQNGNNVSYWSNVWRCQGVAGGGAAVVVTFNGTAGYFSGSCEEFATCAASPVDSVTTGDNFPFAAGNLVITTPAKAQNTSIVYATAASSRVISGGATIAGPTTGDTQTALETGAGFLGVANGYKETAAGGTESATWTTTSQDLSGIVVVYKKVVSVPSGLGKRSMRFKQHVMQLMSGVN